MVWQWTRGCQAPPSNTSEAALQEMREVPPRERSQVGPADYQDRTPDFLLMISSMLLDTETRESPGYCKDPSGLYHGHKFWEIVFFSISLTWRLALNTTISTSFSCCCYGEEAANQRCSEFKTLCCCSCEQKHR